MMGKATNDLKNRMKTLSKMKKSEISYRYDDYTDVEKIKDCKSKIMLIDSDIKTLGGAPNYLLIKRQQYLDEIERLENGQN